MTEIELLGAAVRECRGLLASSEIGDTAIGNTNVLVRNLSRAHDWTEEGARVIVTLANDYGAFMLRDALALAIALRKEDGDLGF